mmetsp:Transcript_17005/g.34073  ORF Transcript_17005/g.34073 Transcript_17005/m.34073 type:complete len:287 (+) Transcript_17005:254-1114(+)
MGFGELVREGPHALEAEVEALARHGVDAVGGVAHQHLPLLVVRPGVVGVEGEEEPLAPQRVQEGRRGERAARAEGLVHVDEAQAVDERGGEVIYEADACVGLVAGRAPLEGRVHGVDELGLAGAPESPGVLGSRAPHDAVVAAPEGEEGEGAGGEEALECCWDGRRLGGAHGADKRSATVVVPGAAIVLALADEAVAPVARNEQARVHHIPPLSRQSRPVHLGDLVCCHLGVGKLRGGLVEGRHYVGILCAHPKIRRAEVEGGGRETQVGGREGVPHLHGRIGLAA